MKGVVFNLLETVVARDHGEDVWDALLDDTGLDGVYTSLGNYDDADLTALAAAAAARLSISTDEVIRWFGRNALPLLADHYPHLFAPHDDARSFVLTLNAIIHPEVRKLYPGAVTPEFSFDAADPDCLVMTYCSPRKLCAFAEGLLQGTAGFYSERVDIAQPECMNRGDEQCRLEITFDR